MKKPLRFIQNETILGEYGNAFSKPFRKIRRYNTKQNRLHLAHGLKYTAKRWKNHYGLSKTKRF